MWVGVLGPVVVRRGGVDVPVSGQRLRALLALLALEPGQVVGTGRLIDGLWGERLPANVGNALQALVSRLRAVLGRDAVPAEGGAGYRLAVGEVDAYRFADLVAQARKADPVRARELFAQALDLWRGPPLADIRDAPYAPAAAARLDEQRLAAIEDFAEVCLGLGRPDEALAAISEPADHHPLRERTQAVHVRALYAAGRQAAALRAYDRARRALADELGVDPGPELAAAHLAVLRAEEPVPPRTNLPAQLTSFVGRDEELRRVGKLLAAHRLVTLVGPGGAGKTRTACEAAARQDPPDGVWLVELAPVGGPLDVPHAALTVLNIREPGALLGDVTAVPREPTERLVEGLRNRRLLLVLDNCEHVVDAAAQLVDRILAGCPQVTVLATSREPLGITGEALCPVGPLALPPDGADPDRVRETAAVRLFLDRAQAVCPGFDLDGGNAAQVVRICTRLDGLPLAIELAAARLRALTAGQVADRLGDRFRLLTGGSRTALPRHQTLRAVVDWSWDLLTDSERTLARRLSVFAGGCTLDAVEAVHADSVEMGHDADPLDALASLVDKSLVEVADGRYRMLETIRAYAAEALAAAGEAEATRRRHAAYFLDLAETSEPELRGAGQLDWIHRLGAEHDNVTAALRYSVDSGDGATALRLCAGLGWYWWLLGYRSEAAAWSRQVLPLLGDTPPPGLAGAYAGAVFTVGLADFVTAQFDPEKLAGLGEEMRRLIRVAAAEGPVHPMLRIAEAIIPAVAGRQDEAFALLSACVDDPDRWLSASARMMRGAFRVNSGELRAAEDDLRTALADFRAVGDRWGLSQALMSMAEFTTHRGDLAAAAGLLEEAAALVLDWATGDETLMMVTRLAGLRAAGGDLAGARAELARVRRMLDTREPEATAAAMPHLMLVEADLANREGAPGTALAIYEQALSGLATQPAPPHQRAYVMALVARTLAADAADLPTAGHLPIADDLPTAGPPATGGEPPVKARAAQDQAGIPAASDQPLSQPADQPPDQSLGQSPGQSPGQSLGQDRAGARRDQLDRARALLPAALDMITEVRDLPVRAAIVAAAAVLAAADDAPERAAVLFGALAALRDVSAQDGTGEVPEPTEPDAAAAVRRARSALGDPAYAEAHARGVGLAPDAVDRLIRD